MFNTAWSSSRNGANERVTFLQQALVSAHGTYIAHCNRLF